MIPAEDTPPDSKDSNNQSNAAATEGSAEAPAAEPKLSAGDKLKLKLAGLIQSPSLRLFLAVMGGITFGIVLIFVLLAFTPLKKMLMPASPEAEALKAQQLSDAQDKAARDKRNKEKIEELMNIVNHPLPEILVNLASQPNSSKKNFLKMKIFLELGSKEEVKQVELLTPRIIDQIQVYLREMTISELQGANGVIHLREQLLIRINAVTAPIVVRDVLFESLIIK